MNDSPFSHVCAGTSGGATLGGLGGKPSSPTRARDEGCAQGACTQRPRPGPGVRLGSALRGVSSVPGRHRPERRAAGAPEPQRPQRAGGSQHGARAGGAVGPARAPGRAALPGAGGGGWGPRAGATGGRAVGARAEPRAPAGLRKSGVPAGARRGQARRRGCRGRRAQGGARGAEGCADDWGGEDGGAAAARAIRSQLVFVLCRASSLTAREPRRRLREMLRDVRGRRAGAALVGVLVAEAGPEDAVAPGLRLLEALLRAVFGRQAGGPVQAAAYCPGLPSSCLAVQAAACRALQAAGAGQPVEGAWERPGLPGLLACFSWGPWSGRKDQDVAACRSPAHENFQEPEEELALTAVFPNGDCEDLGRGSEACDGVVHTPAEPTGESR
uniref:C2orf72-like C-terminal domain-containing protein n=1 Tax=Macaca fascicularis TaxID=9541 RepID=A0A2K5W922_MACFA